MAHSQVTEVIVIGAGIQGAGVAQALAACGYQVQLIEQASHPAAETSSNSSKLIHGGLRYLETGQFSLVRECLKERAILCKIAPHLVQLRPFYIPIYQGQQRSAAWVYAGLSLYRLLGGGPFKRHSSSHAQALGMDTAGLTQLFEYQDAQTDDAALTRAVVASAQSLGAQLLFDEKICAIAKTDEGFQLTSLSGKTFTAPCVINATGAFINEVARLCSELPQTAIELVQGSHLVIDHPAPAGCIYTTSNEDGRPVFMLPWQGKLMVGTTEHSLGNNPYAKAITYEERAYLIRAAKHCLPALREREVEVTHTYCGVRVLPSGQQAANKKVRETQLTTLLSDSHQYLAIYGGKLTAYRATAEKAVKTLMPYLPKRRFVSTRDLPLPK